MLGETVFLSNAFLNKTLYLISIFLSFISV